MKKKFMILLLFYPLLVGCNIGKIPTPTSLNDQIIVSHLKDSKLSFVNLKNDKLKTSDLDYRITAMQKVDKDTVIIAGENQGSLFRLQLKDGHYKQFVETGAGINDLLFLSEYDLLLYSNGQKNMIGFYDLNQDKVTDEVVVGDQPISMAFNPSTKEVYVVNAKEASISVIDIDSKKVVRHFSILYRPNGVFFDGQNIWIGGHGAYGTLNNNVYVYNPKNGKEIDRVEVGSMPVDFYGDKTSPFIYVICHGSSSVFQIDRETRTVSDPIEVGTNPYDIIGDDQNIYVSSIDGNALTVIDRSTFRVEKSIPVEKGPHLMILGDQNE